MMMILTGLINIGDVNLRVYEPSKSTAYHVDNMIASVRIINQQDWVSLNAWQLEKIVSASDYFIHWQYLTETEE